MIFWDDGLDSWNTSLSFNGSWVGSLSSLNSSLGDGTVSISVTGHDWFGNSQTSSVNSLSLNTSVVSTQVNLNLLALWLTLVVGLAIRYISLLHLRKVVVSLRRLSILLVQFQVPTRHPSDWPDLLGFYRNGLRPGLAECHYNRFFWSSCS